jgi:hypothetical protein
VARATKNAGHSVQNHTWSHPYLTNLSDAGIRDQLNRTANLVQSVIGVRTTCFRPPYGATNTRVRTVAASTGHTQVMWNSTSPDYAGVSVQRIVSDVLRPANGQGLVVLLHDGGGNRSNTVAALPSIIEGLKARGYTFVRLCGGSPTPPPPPPPPPPPVVDPDVVIPARPGLVSRYVPVVPERILDTRDPVFGRSFLPAGSQITVPVTGRAGAPPDAGAVSAVLVNVTVTQASPGHVTLWGSGPLPPTSTINVDRANGTVANLALVPVGADGKIRVATVIGMHLVLDVYGYLTPADTASAGRVVSLTPVPVLDTTSLPPSSGARTVTVTGFGGVPEGAGAVLLHVVAAGTGGGGWVSVAPGSAPTDKTSVVNVSAGERRANTTFVPILDGNVTFNVSGPLHVQAAVVGWVTGDGETATTSGLVVPLDPTRPIDTRFDAGGPLVPGAPRTVSLDGPAVTGIIGNLTVTQTAAAGAASVQPSCTALEGGTGDVVFEAANRTRAGFALTALDGTGAVCLSSAATTHAILDVMAGLSG